MCFRLKLIFLLLYLPMFSWAQKRVVFEGVSPFFEDGDTVFLSQVLPQQGIRDIKKWFTVLKDGRFTFDFEASGAEIYHIKTQKDGVRELFIAPGYTKAKFKDGFWLQLDIGSGATFDYYHLYQNNEYEKLYVNYRRHMGKLYQSNLTPEIVNLYEKQLDTAKRAFQSYSLKWSTNWIRKNPNSAISSKVLYDQLGFMPDDTLKNLYRLIPDSLLQNSYGKYLQHYVNHLTLGATAPNIIQKTPEGKTVQLTDFRGKYVLIDFWASWCIPCRQVNPQIVAAYQKFKNKNFTILGVSFDSDQKDWIKAIENDKLTWHHISELKSWDNQSAKDYRISSIPNNVLINPEGKIIARSIDPSKLEEVLGQFLGSKK